MKKINNKKDKAINPRDFLDIDGYRNSSDSKDNGRLGREQARSLECYNRSSIARSIVHHIVSHVMIDNVEIVCEDEKQQQYVDDRMLNASEFKAIFRSFIIYGELCVKYVINEFGVVSFVEIGASLIKRLIVDNSSGLVVGILVASDNRELIYNISNRAKSSDQSEALLTNISDGNVLFFRNRLLSTSHRGSPFFFNETLNKTLFSVEDILASQNDRVKAMMLFFLDVKIENANPEEINNRVEKLNAAIIDNKSVIVHGNNEEYKFIAPNIQSADVSEFVKTNMQVVAAAMRIPPLWLGDSNINLSSGREMAKPTIAMIREWQEYAKTILSDMVTVLVTNGASLQPKLSIEFSVIFPEIDDGGRGDIDELKELLPILVMGVSSGLIQQGVAQEIINKTQLFTNFGVATDITTKSDYDDAIEKNNGY